MFVLGHMGIGRALVRPWQRFLPVVAFFAGTLLPDIIDKPLYHFHLLGPMPATRMAGHTGLLVVGVALVALATRSRAVTAVAAGMATHLVLDCVMDLTTNGPYGAWIAACWPLLGPFPPVDIASVTAHFARLFVWPVIAGEIIGGALLLRDLIRARRPAHGTMS